MPPSLRRPTTNFPPLLQSEIGHAHRFARTLGTLHAEVATDDPAFVWLEGRAEEVRVFTLDVVRAWSSGEVTLGEAVRGIASYLNALHASLEGWYGQWYAPSCCGPLSSAPESGLRRLTAPRVRRRVDSGADTLTDAPVADGEPRRLRMGGVAVMGA